MGTAVAKLKFYDEACRALGSANTVDEVAQINNEAVGMQAYARQAKNKLLELESGEIRFKATRRIGQLIALQKASVGLAKGGGDRGKKSPGGVPTLNEAGIDKDLAKLARKLAKLTDAQFEALLAGRRESIAVANAKLAVDLFGAATAYVSSPDPAKIPQEADIAKLLGWTRVDPKAKDLHRPNHTAQACANASKLLDDSYLTRKDLRGLAVQEGYFPRSAATCACRLSIRTNQRPPRFSATITPCSHQ
jgi:hypothetical protein